MQHPLRQARPSDPFLRLRLEDRDIGPYAVDGDHIALLRTGRMSGETWVTALGDDPARILALVEELRPHGFDGVTVHDHVFEHLPSDLRGPDPGHWSLWEFAAPAVRTTTQLTSAVRLDPHDVRIDPLLAHSDSAYIYAGHPKVIEWRGILEGDRLIAVGAWTVSAGGVAHLVSICTDPDFRGRGLGRAMTQALTSGALQRGARGVTLEMYVDNAAAARAYGSVGFLERGRYLSASLHGPSSPAAEE
jgi:GNAT superfamily N-acetyltransferase